MSVNQNPFGLQVQKIRKSLKLTQLGLGQQIDVSKSYISFLEKGVRHPSREVADKIARVLFPNTPDKQDELLILAGFSSDNIKDNYINNMESLSPGDDFRRYLISVLAAIKAGQFELARDKIETGLKYYDKPAQMHTLLAHLELAKGKYEHAIISQQAAIQHYNLIEENDLEDLKYSDFLVNLGVMYFFKGDHHMFAYRDEQESDKELSERELARAQKYYLMAQEQFLKGLELESDNVYYWDEYARLLFNLADISSRTQAQKFWQETIDSFEKVLSLPNKHILGQNTLAESTIYLAHAYSKMGEFQISNTILNVLTNYVDKNWLVYYIKACRLSMLYESEPNDSLLDQALIDLKTAFKLDAQHTNVLSFIVQDQNRELKALSSLRSDEFKKLVNQK